jgi:3-mercaptopyruvate sulfurtransferase SseA
VRSALLAVLLEARLGIVAANYDGSLWEWSADPSLPLVK